MKRKSGSEGSPVPLSSGSLSPLEGAKRRTGGGEGDGGKRPPRILNWLQSEGSKQGVASSGSELPEAALQKKVEQYMKMVTSVWKDDAGRAEALRRLLQRDILVGSDSLRMSGREWQMAGNAAEFSAQGASSCSEQEQHLRTRLRDAGSPVPQTVQSRSTSDGEVAQEARSVSTAGSASIGDRRVELCSISTSGGFQVSDGLLDAGSVSPTLYASHLASVKLAMLKGSSSEEPDLLSDKQLLEDYIAAKWNELRGRLPDGAGLGAGLGAGFPGSATNGSLTMEGIVKNAQLEQEILEGSVRRSQLERESFEQRQRPPCADHSSELLERIVVEVRKVVLGVAPLKGSILEQVAEAASSNKAIVISPCETCGVPASADMAQILSVSLGHTEEASKLRIGHAAVALLNARAHERQGVSFPTLAWGGAPPPQPPPPELDIPSPSTAFCGGLNTPEQEAPCQGQRLSPALKGGPQLRRCSSSVAGLAAGRHPSLQVSALPFLTPPAPKFQGSLDRAILLPPLPTFNGNIVAPPLIRQQSAPPSVAVDAVYPPGSEEKRFDSWQRRASETPPSLPTSIAGLRAYPMLHGGMSVLLTSKASAGEAALTLSPRGALAEGIVLEGSLKGAAKRMSDALDDVFVSDGPTAERQLSADELTIQGYLEQEQGDLCPMDADAFPPVQLSSDVQLSADDEFDLEDPMEAPHDWEGFLKGDLARSPSPSPQDRALMETASFPGDCQLSQSMTVVMETASCLTEAELQGSPSAPMLSSERESIPWLLNPTTLGENRGPEQCSAARVNDQTESTVNSGLTTERRLTDERGLTVEGGLTTERGLTGESGARVKKVTIRSGVLSSAAQHSQKMRSLTELYGGVSQRLLDE